MAAADAFCFEVLHDFGDAFPGSFTSLLIDGGGNDKGVSLYPRMGASDLWSYLMEGFILLFDVFDISG